MLQTSALVDALCDRAFQRSEGRMIKIAYIKFLLNLNDLSDKIIFLSDRNSAYITTGDVKIYARVRWQVSTWAFCTDRNMLKACSIGLCEGGKCLAMGFETFVKDSVKYFASGQDSLEIMSLLCFLSFLTIQFCFLQNNINQMQNTKGRPRPVT